jgi:hypothetical protein
MSSQRFKNELRGNQDDPDFDLDSYIDEQANAIDAETFDQEYVEPPTSTKRNIIALLLFAVIPAVWFLTSSPISFFNFDNGNQTTVSQGQNVVQAPLPPAAPLPPRISTTEGVTSVYLDYLQAANEAGYTNQINPTGIRALYDSGVPLSYLEQMNQAGFLDDFSYSGIIGLYNGGVPMEYLTMMNEAGYLDDFSYSGIIGLYFLLCHNWASKFRRYYRLYNSIKRSRFPEQLFLFRNHRII